MSTVLPHPYHLPRRPAPVVDDLAERKQLCELRVAVVAARTETADLLAALAQLRPAYLLALNPEAGGPLLAGQRARAAYERAYRLWQDATQREQAARVAYTQAQRARADRHVWEEYARIDRAAARHAAKRAEARYQYGVRQALADAAASTAARNHAPVFRGIPLR